MFLECIKDLIRLDKDWVPKIENCSLYIRPAYIGTEVCYNFIMLVVSHQTIDIQ